MDAIYLGERYHSDYNLKPSRAHLGALKALSNDPLSLKCELENVKVERLLSIMDLQSKHFYLIHCKPQH